MSHWESLTASHAYNPIRDSRRESLARVSDRIPSFYAPFIFNFHSKVFLVHCAACTVVVIIVYLLLWWTLQWNFLYSWHLLGLMVLYYTARNFYHALLNPLNSLDVYLCTKGVRLGGCIHIPWRYTLRFRSSETQNSELTCRVNFALWRFSVRNLRNARSHSSVSC